MNQHGKSEGHGLNEFLFQKGNYMISGSIKKHPEPEHKKNTRQQFLPWYDEEDNTYHPGYSGYRPQLTGPGVEKDTHLPSETEIEKTISQAVDKKLFINAKVKRSKDIVGAGFAEIGTIAGFVRAPSKVQITGGYGGPRKLAVIQVKWPSLGNSVSQLFYCPDHLELVEDEDLPGNQQLA